MGIFCRLGAFAIALTIFSACVEEVTPLVAARCVYDTDCGKGLICEDGACVPKENFSCEMIENGSGILQPSPAVIEFDRTGPATSFKTLSLRNIGNCTLTIFDAYFEGPDKKLFECPDCAAEKFPIELFPLRDGELDIAFTPETVGEFTAELHLLSDDREYADIKIPVRARHNGVPTAKVIPEAIDFGFLSVGRTVSKSTQISNHGTGQATLSITDIHIEPAEQNAFSLTRTSTHTVVLPPIAMNHTAVLAVSVDYHPREIAAHKAELVIVTDLPTAGTIRVPLSGTSETPPKINVSPAMIAFGEIPLGQTNVVPVTIVNEGGAPLNVHYRWGGMGFSTDLGAVPAVLPAVAPGGYTQLNVLATPTRTGEINGLLIFESNDPQHPSQTIAVSAVGTNQTNQEVVKIEMAFSNGDSGVLSDDLRNVDLSLESPYGLLCNEQTASPNWAGFGTPSWMSFGSSEEPERVVLSNVQNDGTYRVIVQYAEDCASVPTTLVAAVLGISVDALVGYLSGGIIGIPGGQISDVIKSLCLSHAATDVSIAVSVNGSVVAERSMSLGRKGEISYALEIIRRDGRFSVR